MRLVADYAAAMGDAVDRVNAALRYLGERASDQTASLRDFQRWLILAGVIPAARTRSDARRRRKHPNVRRRRLRT